MKTPCKNVVINLMKSGVIPKFVEYDYAFTANEFINNLKKLKFHSFQKYNKISLLTFDVHRLKRQLAWIILLKWSSKKAIIISPDGNYININYFLLIRITIIFARELIRIIPEYLINKRNIKKAKNNPNKIIFYKNHIKDRKDIVYINASLGSEGQSGGSVTHSAGVMNGLKRLGYNLHFFSGNKNPLLNNKVDLNLYHQYERYPNLYDVENLFANRVLENKIYPLLKTGKIKFIYQRYSPYSYIGLSLARKYGLPFILEFNSPILWVSKNWGNLLLFPRLAQKIENTLLCQARLVTVVSEVLKKNILKIGVKSKSILVNTNGVDINVFHPNIDGTLIRKRYNLEGKIVIGFIGTFGPWHGSEFLAEVIGAMDKLPEKYNLHFLLIGNGQCRSKAEDIIRRSGSFKYCTFTGMIPQRDGPKYLSACDFFVSPHVANPDGTEFFGSPTKLFEYMAMGKGVVANNLNQIGDILKNRKTALLVEVGNVTKFAEAILELANDLPLRKILGKNARDEVCKNYTWEKHVLRLIEKIEEIISINGK